MSSPGKDVVGGVLMRDRRILLGLRSEHRTWFPSVWDVFGGHVESGESVEATLVRELQEELSVTATEFEPIGLLTDIEPTCGGSSRTLHLFKVTDWTGAGPRLSGDEHDDIRWCTLDEAVALDLALDAYRDVFRLLLTRC